MFKTDPRRVDDLLAQFPGPIKLKPNPIASLLLLALCIAIFVSLVMLEPNPSSTSRPLYPLARWCLLLLMPFAILAVLYNSVPGLVYITLDRDGFTTTLFRDRFTAWDETESFFAGTGTYRFVTMYRLKDDGLTPPEPYMPAQSVVRYLGNYGLWPREFSRLMNEWRAKALGSR